MDTEPHQRLFTTAFVVRFLTGMWLLKCPKGQFSVLCTQHRGMTFVLLYYPEQRVLLLSRLSLQRLKASVDLQLWQDAQHVRLWMNCGIFFFSITRLRLSENSFVLRLLNFCADFFCFVFVLFFLHSLERNVRINLSMQFRASFFLSLFYRMAASCKCNVTSQSESLGAI